MRNLVIAGQWPLYSNGTKSIFHSCNHKLQKKKKILSLWAPFSHRHENSTNKSRYFINYDSHTTEKQEEYDEGKKKVYKNSYYIPLKTQKSLLAGTVCCFFLSTSSSCFHLELGDIKIILSKKIHETCISQNISSQKGIQFYEKYALFFLKIYHFV